MADICITGLCKAYDGKPVLRDFSAVLPVLPFFPVLLRFWEADDEFPAQLQFLWDRNSMRYLTYETSFYTHGAILDRLLEADM